MDGISPDTLSVVQRGLQELAEANSEIFRLLDLIENRQNGQQAGHEDDSDTTESKARAKHQKLESAIAKEKEEQNGEAHQTVTSDIDRTVTETEHYSVFESSPTDNRHREEEIDEVDSDDRVNSLQETDNEDKASIVPEDNKSDSESSVLEQELLSDEQEVLNKVLRSKVTVLRRDNRLDDEFKGDLLEYMGNIKDPENIDSDRDDDTAEVEVEEVLPVEIVEFYAKDIDQTPRKEVDRVTIDVELWTTYAKLESRKGWLARPLYENGFNTIFCLDTSMSMKGKPMKQAKAFVKHYIQGIQSTNPTDNEYEHVALVTFGGETRVQQHLTIEYFELLTKLERVRPFGPSPLFAGLRMCWAAVVGAGISSSPLADKNPPKVYLLTDGRITPTSLFAGPDTCTEDEEKLVENQVLHYCIYLHKTYHLSFNAVCIGDCNKSILEEITAQTNGEMITIGDWTLEPEPAENEAVAAASTDDDDSFQQYIHQPETEQYIENTLSEGSSNHSDGNEEGFIKVESYDRIGRYFQQCMVQRDSDCESAAEDTKNEKFLPVAEKVSTVTENVTEALSTAKQAFTWRWKDSGGTWKTYSDEINKTVESHYEKDPRGFVIITHDNKQYKIIFARMVKIDLNTKEKFPVSRR